MITGFKDLDNLMMIRPGEVIVLGGRPAMGKSCLLRQIAMNMCADGLAMVWLVDLQNNPKETQMLCMCQEAEIERNLVGPINSFEEGHPLKLAQLNQEAACAGDRPDLSKLDGVSYQRLVAAANAPQIQHLNIIDLESDNEFEELLKMKEWPDILVIDTIQMLSICLESWFEIAHMVKRLKRRAIKEDTVVILGSDISRKVDERQGHRPMMGDLSDSSALEEVANKVLFLQRRDYYDPNDKPGLAEVQIVKDSVGNGGIFALMFRKEIGKFVDYEPPVLDYSDNDAFTPR